MQQRFTRHPAVRCRVVALIATAWVGLSAGGCASAPRAGKQAGWTILCSEIKGPSRMQIAQQLVDTLEVTPGIRADEVYLRDDPDDVARIYYGGYERPLDKATNRRATPANLRRDIDYIKRLGTEDGRHLFLGAMPVRTPQSDVGNPEWDLRRVTGTYTLQVAAFEPTDTFSEYKQAAADYCALLRQQGFEAYYYHDRSSSIVTVGLFGPDGVDIGPDGRSYYSQTVRDLQKSEALQYNLVNGRIFKVRAADGSFVAMPSRLVHLPEKSEPSPW